MKTPLRYQFTNHDCRTATMENAISYMIPREKLPPDLLHYIYNFNLSVLFNFNVTSWAIEMNDNCTDK